MLNNSDAAIAFYEQRLLPAVLTAVPNGTPIVCVGIAASTTALDGSPVVSLADFEASAPSNFDFDAAWRSVARSTCSP